MNIEEHKQEARTLEQQGETEGALALYEKILAELEGTPEIGRELPLYVKAGDLSLKLNDSSNAISHYEKAANEYAVHGSSKRVIALCTKILRVNPGRTHVFLRLVRLMIEREHLADARLVLIEYAARLKLPKTGLVLEELANSPEEQMKSLLEMLLEMGGRYEYARAQGRDHTTEADAFEEKPSDEADAAVADTADSAAARVDDAGGLPTSEELESNRARQDECDEAELNGGELASEEEPEQEEVPDRAADDAAAPAPAVSQEGEIHWADERPSTQLAVPRGSRQVLYREADYDEKKPTALWIGLGAAVVVVVGGLSLVLFDVIPLGGSGANGAVPPLNPQAAASDSTLMAGTDPGDSTGAEGDSSAVESADSTARVIAGAVATDQRGTTTVAEDSTSVIANMDEPVRSESTVFNDTAVGDQPETPADPVVEPPLPPSMGVMVQDFGIETSTEFDADGRVGYRITQILGTGERLTLAAVYYGEDIASAPGTAWMTLAPLAGDTTTAIIQFSGYAVEARAIVSASVLEALLARLIEVPRTN